MRMNNEHFQASRICKSRKKLSKTAKKRLSFNFTVFTANTSVSDAGADEEPYPAKIKEHRFLPSKNLWADLSKFLSEI